MFHFHTHLIILILSYTGHVFGLSDKFLRGIHSFIMSYIVQSSTEWSKSLKSRLSQSVSCIMSDAL